MDHRLNCKSSDYNTLRRKQEKLHNISFGNSFFAMPQKAQ